MQQTVGLGAAGFLVERVALEGDEVLPVEQQAVHMAGAVGQPFDAVAVGAGGTGALVEFMVVVVPDRVEFEVLEAAVGARLNLRRSS